MGAGEDGATAYAEAGLTAYDIGDEAIVDMAAFSLTGPGMKEVRRSFTRLQRRGYTARVVRHASLTEADFAALSDAAGAWRGDGGDERGFSMALGRLADPLDGGCVLVQAIDGDGRLRGFLSFVPWGRSGLSLDLMRRDPTADNGLVEFMVASLAGQAATFGIGPVSLNFAMFREAFERGAQIGAGPVLRLWRQGLLMASKNWQLESLYRSNAKYLPEWQPRFICFEYTSDLPRVGIAAGSAEGFLTRPTISLLHRTGTVGGRARDRWRRARRRRPGPDPTAARRRRGGTLDRPPPRAGARTPGQARPAARAGRRPLPGRLPAHAHARAGASRGG